MKTVPQMLEEAAETYRQRNGIYKDSYRRHGKVMEALLPDAMATLSERDHARFGVLTMIVGKLVRYCINFNSGGHVDSVHDLIVYSAILAELDSE